MPSSAASLHDRSATLVKHHFTTICRGFFPSLAVHRAGSTEGPVGHVLVILIAQYWDQALNGERGAAMSVGSGEKRRRKRDRQFLEFYDTLSLRATVAGVGGSIALLLFVVARSVFSS
jgi:hypothetical protein